MGAVSALFVYDIPSNVCMCVCVFNSDYDILCKGDPMFNLCGPSEKI